MPKTRPPYPPEFRQQMVDLVRAGRTPRELAREFEPTYETIRNGVRQANRDDGLDRSGMTTKEREELRQCSGNTQGHTRGSWSNMHDWRGRSR